MGDFVPAPTDVLTGWFSDVTAKHSEAEEFDWSQTGASYLQVAVSHKDTVLPV